MCIQSGLLNPTINLNSLFLMRTYPYILIEMSPFESIRIQQVN